MFPQDRCFRKNDRGGEATQDSGLRGCEEIDQSFAADPSSSSTAPATQPPPRFRRLRMTRGREATQDSALRGTQHSGLSTQDFPGVRPWVQFNAMLTIRHAVAADAAPLAAFGERTFRVTFAADNDARDLDMYLAEAYNAAQQAAEIADPSFLTLIAELAGMMAGFAQLRDGAAPSCVEGPMPVELLRFYVDHAFHGRGIAQSLMNNTYAEARRRGARTLWLGVWERNERAKAFYRKCGFVDVGSHIFVVGSDPQTDRLMVRVL
jgi:ribosomal protein S18 acetylase RimI-like enzyme